MPFNTGGNDNYLIARFIEQMRGGVHIPEDSLTFSRDVFPAEDLPFPFSSDHSSLSKQLQQAIAVGASAAKKANKIDIPGPGGGGPQVPPGPGGPGGPSDPPPGIPPDPDSSSDDLPDPPIDSSGGGNGSEAVEDPVGGPGGPTDPGFPNDCANPATLGSALEVFDPGDFECADCADTLGNPLGGTNCVFSLSGCYDLGIGTETVIYCCYDGVDGDFGAFEFTQGTVDPVYDVVCDSSGQPILI